jgi:hypothetical protein
VVVSLGQKSNEHDATDYAELNSNPCLVFYISACTRYCEDWCMQLDPIFVCVAPICQQMLSQVLFFGRECVNHLLAV